METGKFDFKEGDIVQLTKGEHSGRMGEIVGVTHSRKDNSFAYRVKLSDRSTFIGSACIMKMVRSS